MRIRNTVYPSSFHPMSSSSIPSHPTSLISSFSVVQPRHIASVDCILSRFFSIPLPSLFNIPPPNTSFSYHPKPLYSHLVSEGRLRSRLFCRSCHHKDQLFFLLPVWNGISNCGRGEGGREILLLN